MTGIKQTGDIVDIQRSGRPRKTTAAEDRRIKTMRIRDRFKSVSEMARNLRGHAQIGHKTVIRRLNAHGLRCRRLVQKQVLRPFHIAWAVRHRRWTMRQWSRIIW